MIPCTMLILLYTCNTLNTGRLLVMEYFYNDFTTFIEVKDLNNSSTTDHVQVLQFYQRKDTISKQGEHYKVD